MDDNNAATGDYYSDDYEDEYNDNDNEVNRSNDTLDALQSEPAYFLKDEYTIHANEGSTAILECDAQNFKGELLSLYEKLLNCNNNFPHSQ